MESGCEVIRCGNMYLVPGQVTEAPSLATFLSLHDSSWQDGILHHNARTPSPSERCTPWTWIFAQREPEIWFSLFKFRISILALPWLYSRLSPWYSSYSYKERREKIREIISSSVWQWTRVLPSFQVSLLSHLARDYREICTRYNTLEYYFRKLEIWSTKIFRVRRGRGYKHTGGRLNPGDNIDIGWARHLLRSLSVPGNLYIVTWPGQREEQSLQMGPLR